MMLQIFFSHFFILITKIMVKVFDNKIKLQKNI